MKDRLKAVLASAVTLVVCVWISTFYMEPDYILARITPDFQINTGYVDPAYLVDDKWTSIVQTSYENGEETGRTTFHRYMFGDYKITHTAKDLEKNLDVDGREITMQQIQHFQGQEDLSIMMCLHALQADFETMQTDSGEEIVLMGHAGGGDFRNEYVAGQLPLEGELFLSSRYDKDLIERVERLVVFLGDPYEDENQLVNFVELEYLGTDFLIKQTKRTNEEILGYRVMEYEERRISKTKDYDAQDTLLTYTEYQYEKEGTLCETVTYNAADQQTGSTETVYDWFGRIRTREHFDGEGNLTGREQYHYRVWELYQSLEGMLVLLGILGFSATIGVGVYDDRIRIPKKETE